MVDFGVQNRPKIDQKTKQQSDAKEVATRMAKEAPMRGSNDPQGSGLRALGRDSPLSAGQTPLAFVGLEWREFQKTRRSRFLTHVNTENEDSRPSKA